MAETYRNRAARAAAVTRALRDADVVVLPSGTPRSREGVRVTSSLDASARVTMDIDGPAARLRLAEAVTRVLEAAGYDVRPNPLDASILYPQKRA